MGMIVGTIASMGVDFIIDFIADRMGWDLALLNVESTEQESDDYSDEEPAQMIPTKENKELVKDTATYYIYDATYKTTEMRKNAANDAYGLAAENSRSIVNLAHEIKNLTELGMRVAHRDTIGIIRTMANESDAEARLGAEKTIQAMKLTSDGNVKLAQETLERTTKLAKEFGEKAVQAAKEAAATGVKLTLVVAKQPVTSSIIRGKNKVAACRKHMNEVVQKAEWNRKQLIIQLGNELSQVCKTGYNTALNIFENHQRDRSSNQSLIKSGTANLVQAGKETAKAYQDTAKETIAKNNQLALDAGKKNVQLAREEAAEMIKDAQAIYDSFVLSASTAVDHKFDAQSAVDTNKKTV